MKQKIKFSSFSIITTAAVMVIFVIGVISVIDNPDKLITLGVIAGITTIAGAYYCPTSVEASETGIILHRLMSRPKEFSYDMIQSVESCYPSAGGIRLCGSGGFFGYWGYFSDIMIGTYFGYYGSRDNCMLLKLKNGHQYVIGGSNIPALVNFIQLHLN